LSNIPRAQAKVKPVDLSLMQTIRARISASPEAGAFIGFVAVFVFFALTAQSFLTPDAFASILTKQSVLGIVTVGIAFLMISGEFDLSVGSILAVSGIVFGQILLTGGSVLIAALAAVAVGAALGLVNGVILVVTRIPSFIVTLGTLLAFRAIALTATGDTGILRYTGDDPTIIFAPWVLALIGVALAIVFAIAGFILGRSRWRNIQNSKHTVDRALNIIGLILATIICGALTLFFVAFVISLFGDFSTPITVSVFDILNGQLTFLRDAIGGNFRSSTIWFLIIVVIFSIVLTQTRYGNAVFATGGNAAAARAQGIPVNRVKVINFMISGTLAGFAAIVEFARLTSASGDRGTGWELEAIAAAVIGGSLLSGGYGSIIGALIGVILSGMLSTGLVLIGVPAFGFRGYIGVILVIAVVINNLARRQS
jgi:ribose/xylose/arabinose/galactoside ABC-type transport system permease subunit